jgi:hypothetical protein
MAAKTKKTPNRKIYIPEYFGGEDGWGPVGPPEGPGYPTDPPGWGEFPPWPASDDAIPPEPGGGGPVLPDPGYEVQISPQTRVILQGRTAVYTIWITPQSDFVRNPLYFSFFSWNDVLPNNADPPLFSPNPISSLQGRGPFRITLAIPTRATIPLGQYGFNLWIGQTVFGNNTISNQVPEGRLIVTRLHRTTLKAPPVG